MSNHPQVLSDAQVRAEYGNFAWSMNGDSNIEIKGNWVQRNIIRVYVPTLDGVQTYGGRFSGQVSWHKDGAERLLHAFEEIKTQGLEADVLFWGGSFVPRRVRGAKSLSHHSWGIALDLNPDQNPYRKPPAAMGTRGSVLRLVPIFEKHGFAWGGGWNPNTDGMHFELAEARDYRQITPDADIKLILDGRTINIAITLKNGVAFASLKKLAKATGDIGVQVDRSVAVRAYLDARGYSVSWNAQQNTITATSQPNG
jgi:hypothetical protein